jgi:hypothetical protein
MVRTLAVVLFGLGAAGHRLGRRRVSRGRSAWESTSSSSQRWACRWARRSVRHRPDNLVLGSGGLRRDRPELANRFNATYWGSQFTDKAVQAYADSLRNAISDPTGDAVVVLGDITVSDIVLGADAQRTYQPSWWLRPYLGAGIATHIVNADGRLIDGTFVERATDVIAVGVAGSVGVNARVLRHIALDAQARYDFLSLARFGSLRIGASYYFDNPRPRTR